MIGAPLDTITLLHYAEHKAQLPGKRIYRYRRLMPGDCFERIATDHLNSGVGSQGMIGAAMSYLFEAPELVRFGVDWLERFVTSNGE